jgi:branched-chain amino acid aminotransferase|uniref:aminotransferase class IV n=1 Tax=Cephaloticoccus sp. TaxID=1985742 RepID=UPI00404B19A1
MRPDYIQANTNGRLHDAREPSLSPLDRGFLYGDAVYEVWRTYDGVLFAWLEHWQRLQRSAAALHLVVPWCADEILSEIKRTVDAFREQVRDRSELYVRLQVSRGGGPIGLDVALADEPNFTILVQTNQTVPAVKMKSGYTLSLESALRRNSVATLNPAWKTGNYLNNLLCLREAKARGADEVLMLNLAGEITEASVSNIGFIQQGRMVTPSLKSGILGGITRELVVHKIASAAGIPIEELALRPEDLTAMDECFIMSTTRDIAPVGMIDKHPYRVDAETITMRLKTAFASYVADYVATHAELKIT